MRGADRGSAGLSDSDRGVFSSGVGSSVVTVVLLGGGLLDYSRQAVRLTMGMRLFDLLCQCPAGHEYPAGHSTPRDAHDLGDFVVLQLRDILEGQYLPFLRP